MEKRESKRQRTLTWGHLYANAKIGEHTLKLPILDISIGGMGVLVSDGFSLLQEGKAIHIETLENKGGVIAADIHGA
jgi:c-di-GMP-binding flagellar brake protein YcgR